MKKLKHITYICLCVNLLMLTSCGVKPSHVEPPEGVEHDRFPHTYPDTRTDPQPGMDQKY